MKFSDCEKAHARLRTLQSDQVELKWYRFGGAQLGHVQLQSDQVELKYVDRLSS